RKTFFLQNQGRASGPGKRRGEQKPHHERCSLCTHPGKPQGICGQCQFGKALPGRTAPGDRQDRGQQTVAAHHPGDDEGTEVRSAQQPG
ncbi:hypothetical protein, partial [Algoriphagus sp.]|uniref:hypothetical protein n=1 Tax=Algoriphagus sp. TaxID=1872435 RepID=UPI003F6FF891